MNNLMVFENQQVEVLNFDGTVLFNPYHVGKCIDLSESAVRNYLQTMNEKQAILVTNAIVRNKDIRKMHTTGEKFLTESGLYKLIFKSRKPEAERFTDWVTDEVLPSIRKTGKYEAPVERPKKALQVLNLKGMKVVSNAEIARYMRVSNAVVRHHATMLGEYGILLGGREIARLKRDNPSLSPFLSILVVYSLGVAERILDRMNAITRPLSTKVPTRVPTKPMPYVKPEPKMVHDGIDEALAAFNYLVKNRPNTGNDDINKAFATVLMGIYVDISGKMKS